MVMTKLLRDRSRGGAQTARPENTRLGPGIFGLRLPQGEARRRRNAHSRAGAYSFSPFKRSRSDRALRRVNNGIKQRRA